MKSQLDCKTDQILEEKNKRHASVANKVAKYKVVKQTVGELYDLIAELHLEIQTARQVASVTGKGSNLLC